MSTQSHGHSVHGVPLPCVPALHKNVSVFTTAVTWGGEAIPGQTLWAPTLAPLLSSCIISRVSVSSTVKWGWDRLSCPGRAHKGVWCGGRPQRHCGRLAAGIKPLCAGLSHPAFPHFTPRPRCTRCLGEMLVQTDTMSGGPFI